MSSSTSRKMKPARKPTGMSKLHLQQGCNTQTNQGIIAPCRHSLLGVEQGKLGKERRDQLIAKGQELKETLVDYEERLKELENALQCEAQRLPNLTHPDVAIGGEESAIVVRKVGSQRAFDFAVRPEDVVHTVTVMQTMSE
jgi:seryl-tRNA synthetase